MGSFQDRVYEWAVKCFGDNPDADINYIHADEVLDPEERNHRFLEEALELVQCLACTKEEAHQLVDYVYGRPWGEPSQEVGGVMVTLAALCQVNGFDMAHSGELELARVWGKIDKIRAKQAAKPEIGPLPGPSEPRDDMAEAYLNSDIYTAQLIEALQRCEQILMHPNAGIRDTIMDPFGKSICGESMLDIVRNALGPEHSKPTWEYE